MEEIHRNAVDLHTKPLGGWYPDVFVRTGRNPRSWSDNMVRIRLMRMGKRKQPMYRVVVADQRSPRDGRFIEIIGQYKPLTNPSEIAIDEDKALDWLRKGAQPTEQARALLKRQGIWTKYVESKPKREPAKPKAKAKAGAKK